ncbi:MAG: ABC transporter substrate-binding protein [Campylobacteraceae bacterium]|nr:ABC transporter substrate-binding protein [Campylobacteraceae bacterium]
MSTALSGPTKALGQNMYLGLNLAFQHENDLQKKFHYKITVLDDKYEPDLSAKNMRILTEDKKILAILGNVGTPTANVSVPIANEKKILFFGAFTGAGILRKIPPDKYIINYRASYRQETSYMIDMLLNNGIKAEEIAFFTQNDAYGDAGYYGAVSALEKRGFNKINTLAHGRYRRNTLNVEDGLISILDAQIDPKAIIIVGAYAPVAKFIHLAKEDFPSALFLNVSFVGSNALKKALNKNISNVLVTQVVPHFTSKLRIVKEYLSVLSHYEKNEIFSFVSLEGYIVGRLFIEALKNIPEKNINKENIIKAFENIKDFDIGLGFTSGFSKNNHQFSNKIWLTLLKNNQYIEFKWDLLNKED